MLLSLKKKATGPQAQHRSTARCTLTSFRTHMLANIFCLKCEASVYLKSCLHPTVTLLGLFGVFAAFDAEQI